MAFKMTPGIKGTPASNRVAGLGGCGGPGLPPCPPRFSAEKDIVQRVSDRKISDRATRKATKKTVLAPPKPAPVKLQINLPKGYKFKDELQEKMFYDKFSQALEKGKFKTQEELDKAIIAQLGGTRPVDPKDPKDPGGPIMYDPKDPVFEVPKEGPIKVVPVKGGESEAAPVKKAAVAK